MSSYNISTFADALIAICGAYLVYCAWQLKAKKIVNERFLLSNGVKAKDCTDVDGYVKYMFPKFLVISLVIFIVGTIGVLNDYIWNIQNFRQPFVVIILLDLIAMMIVSGKAQGKFFKKVAQ